MLWYKAWLETRSRFLISLIGIAALCCLFVFRQDRDALSTRMSYFYFVLYTGHQILAALWVIAITLLMMGGLVREKAVGASSFTLALPVSRGRLMRARIGMGILQAFTLGLVPWAAMFLVACLAGQPVAVAQAATYLTVMFGAGASFFAIAVLSASLFEGEYTAPLVAYGALVTLAVVFSDSALRAYSPWSLLFGMNLLEKKSFLLTGPIPWLQILVSAVIAIALLLLSIRIVERREF